MWEAVAGDVAGALVGGAFSAKQASKNRAFQERMANTQYQRSAKDLEAAGLNRVLALGSPAPTTSGAQASHPGPTPGSTGIAAASAKQQIRVGQAQEDLLEEQANAAHADARLKHLEADKQEVLKMLYTKFGPEAESMLDKVTGGSAKNFIQSGFDKIHDWEKKQVERISSGARFVKQKMDDYSEKRRQRQ